MIDSTVSSYNGNNYFVSNFSNEIRILPRDLLKITNPMLFTPSTFASSPIYFCYKNFVKNT